MGWWKRWRKRRACMHHDRHTGQTWTKSQLINMGMGKMIWCGNCDKTWFL